MKAKDNQSVFDIALEQGGSLEAVFDIAVKNNISITDSLQVGQVLIEPEIINKQITEYYRQTGTIPANSFISGSGSDDTGSGIEFWAIEVDFIVS